ncbi:MAG: hypothetical protein QOF24_2919 [Verrucomicrobiota bacterium]|jgi:hypothetical protein
MRALLAPDIVGMWEAGRGQAPIERALSLLFAAGAGNSREELAALSVGRRDSRLLELRQRVFGDTLQAFAECPRCAGHLEIRFATDAIQPAENNAPEILEMESHGITVRFRLPNSIDLADAIGAGEIGKARERLLARCVVEARKEDGTIAPAELPGEVGEEINRRMGASDPAGEVLLELRCPVCAHSWQGLFDIASFFWTEISAQARRLLREVDALARAYGWGEAEILGLSATRRQAYLELIGA